VFPCNSGDNFRVGKKKRTMAIDVAKPDIDWWENLLLNLLQGPCALVGPFSFALLFRSDYIKIAL